MSGIGFRNQIIRVTLLGLAFLGMAAFAEPTERDFEIAVERSDRSALTMVDSVLSRKHTHLFPILVAWYQKQSDPVLKDKVHKKILDAIPKQTALQEVFVNGNSTHNLTGLVQNVTGDKIPENAKGGRTLFIPVSNRHTHEVTEALSKAGALKGVVEVRYTSVGRGTTVPSVTVPFASAELSSSKMLLWVLESRHSELYSAVLEARKRLNTKTSPTREAVTEKILEIAKNAKPAEAQAMREALLKNMVSTQTDMYPPDLRKVVEDKLHKYRTLTIDLQDKGDLRIANLLHKEGLLPEPNPKKVDNKGIEAVHWVNRGGELAEKIQINHVNHDRSGETVSDVINVDRFTARKDGTLKRDEVLQKRSQIIGPGPYNYTRPGAPCDGANAAVSAAATAP